MAQLVGIFGHEGVGTADDDETRARMFACDHQGSGNEVLDPFLAVQTADPADQALIRRDSQRRAGAIARRGIELGQIDHGRDFKGMVRPVGHPSGRGRADRIAHADIARSVVLGTGQGLADQPAMFDQRRAHAQPVERRIDIRHVLRRNDDIRAVQLAAQIVDRVPEAQPIGRGVHVDSQRAQLFVALVGHSGLAEAGNHVDAIAAAIQLLR